MKFDCEYCGKIETALMDGYPFGDHLLEGVIFSVTKDDAGVCTVAITRGSSAYFQKLNQEHWLKVAKEYAEKNDIFECPECKGDVIPDDMLENFQPEELRTRFPDPKPKD